MLREFITIFQSDDPLRQMSERFTRMLSLTAEMAFAAGRLYFEGSAGPDDRRKLYDDDIRVNKLEREIRKLIVAHLSIRKHPADVPHCLFLLSLVKDVERLGDYAKNLSELVEIRQGPVPDDENVTELRAIRERVESTFRQTAEVVTHGDRARAVPMIQEGRAVNKRCDALVKAIGATAAYDARAAVSLALAARYYKRFGGHLLNVLSSVVMPLHKLDFFDEDDLPGD